MMGRSGSVMVLGKISVRGRPVTLDKGCVLQRNGVRRCLCRMIRLPAYAGLLHIS